jgi:hypothetical protein
MKTSVSVLLVYEPDGLKPLVVARLDRRSLLVEFAKAAISEAQARAMLVVGADRVLGDLQREEANRLLRVLSRLLPELRQDSAERSVEHHRTHHRATAGDSCRRKT